MKDFWKKIIKPILIIVLPIIVDEIKKLIEEWLATAPKAPVPGATFAGGLTDFLSSDDFVDRVKFKIDEIL